MSLRAIQFVLSDIGTAIRASRDYSRLSRDAGTVTGMRAPLSGLLPH